MTQAAPLADIRVLDIATFVAAPFCGTILGDFGAEVIKIEQPGEGDPLRKFGTPSEAGDTYVWLSESRNKTCMTLDLRTPDGRETFLALVAKSHVVLENFRPGTLEKWGLGMDVLRAANPKIVLLRVSAYGQTGPYREKAGFARVAHGFSGLSHLAGEADGRPVVPGSTSLADYTSGIWGALGVLLALRGVDRGEPGQVIDVSLYESMFRLLDEMVPVYAKHGVVRGRLGADVPHVVPHGHWQTSEGKWVALACSSDKIFARLARLMGDTPLADARFASNAQRVAARAEVNAAIALWVGRHTREAVVALCDDAGVPCGPIYAVDDIFTDPQYQARGNLVTTTDARAGEVVVPSGMPMMSATPPTLRHLGRALGADTNAILERVLGLAPERIEALRTNRTL